VRLFQYRGRVDPEMPGQQLAALGEDGECLGLAARRRQRAHEQRPRALGQRVIGHHGLQLADQGGRLTQAQLGLDPVLGGLGPGLGQPQRDGVGELRAGRVGQRLTVPQVQRLPQDLGRGLRVARGECPAARGGHGLERQRVYVAWRYRQPVPGRVGLDHQIRAQRRPQPRHQRLQGIAGIGGLLVRPQPAGQHPGGHHPARLQREQREQQAQLPAPDVHGGLPSLHL
jgi:hypothetical protein